VEKKDESEVAFILIDGEFRGNVPKEIDHRFHR
jgi:hypothetical protein